MKAVFFNEHGGPDKLIYGDLDDPVINAGEVLVRVRACALNFLDIWGRRGLQGIRIPFPHVAGSDVAGEIAAVGELGRHFSAGQRVLLFPALSCGRCIHCLSGWDSLCRSYQVLGFQTDGGYAELIKVPAANVIPIPDDKDFEEAAALPLVFLTAWHMLVTRCRIKVGDELLVLGAGSGVGHAAIQIGKLIGARVIATAGSEDKLDKARRLGADEVINHSRRDIVEEVKSLTGKRGVDIVFEHVGDATFEKSVLSLAPGGRLVTCGATTGFSAKLDLRYLFSKQLSLLGSYMGSKSEMLAVVKLWEQGKLTPIVDSVFPLHEAAQAQQRMEERGHFGKVVLRV